MDTLAGSVSASGTEAPVAVIDEGCCVPKIAKIKVSRPILLLAALARVCSETAIHALSVYCVCLRRSAQRSTGS